MDKNPPRLTGIFAGCILAVSLSLSGTALAQNQEPAGINLGGTSFMDGFGRDAPGFTMIEYLQYAMARRFNTASWDAATRSFSGDATEPSNFIYNPKLDVLLLLNQLIYTLPDKLFGDRARLGFDFILPITYFNVSSEVNPPAVVVLTDNGLGIGDITFGPMLQFRPVIVGGRPVFSNRIEFDLIAPIGKYDPNIDINQSSNFFSLNPYWAATVLPIPHLEVSARLNWLYNFKNTRPAIGARFYGQEQPAELVRRLKSAQAGQAGWINFAASYEIIKDLNLGVNGYYFLQFNLDLWEYEGIFTPPDQYTGEYSNQGWGLNDPGKAELFSLGGGTFWKPGEHDKLFFNYYYPIIAKNKPECHVFNLRWVHGF
jgi:hypothetical protein